MLRWQCSGQRLAALPWHLPLLLQGLLQGLLHRWSLRSGLSRQRQLSQCLLLHPLLMLKHLPVLAAPASAAANETEERLC